jgi:hypothetical protein
MVKMELTCGPHATSSKFRGAEAEGKGEIEHPTKKGKESLSSPNLKYLMFGKTKK